MHSAAVHFVRSFVRMVLARDTQFDNGLEFSVEQRSALGVRLACDAALVHVNSRVFLRRKESKRIYDGYNSPSSTIVTRDVVSVVGNRVDRVRFWK